MGLKVETFGMEFNLTDESGNPMLADLLQQGLLTQDEFDRLLKEMEEMMKENDKCYHIWKEVPLFTSVEHHCKLCGAIKKNG